MSDKKYLKHIDGLRALAVISVLLVHLDFSLFSGGYIGVDIFFVISGFLITNIIVKELETTNKFSFMNFYTRRARRIMPALVFTLVLTFILSVWLLNLAKFQIFGGSLAAAIVSVSNIFFYNQAGYFDIFSQSSPLLHTWSLGVEEQFYIFWPIALLIAFKINRKLLIPAVISIFIISLGWSIHRQDVNINSLYYLAPFRAFEFCIGGVIVWLFRLKYNKNILLEFLCIVGFIAILYPLFAYDKNTLFPSYNALMPAIGAALLIYSGTAKYSGYLLRNKAIGFVGLISYSLYLIHWPIIVFVETYNQDMGSAFALSLHSKIIIFFISICAATLMYYFIEQPFRKSIPKAKLKQFYLLCRWSILIILFVILGLSISHSKGWAWRAISPIAASKIDDISKYHRQYWGGSGCPYKGYLYGNTHAEIILNGDSHTGMLDEGFYKEISSPLKINTSTANYSCLNIPGIYRMQKGFTKDGCVDNLNYSLKQLNKATKVFIISYSWAAQIPNARTVISNNNVNSKVLDQSLARLIQSIGTTPLIIFGDVPGSSKFIPSRCIAQLKWFKKDGACLNKQKENITNPSAMRVNKTLQVFAEKHDNVYFINPYDTFCKNGYCSNLDKNGTPYYSDGSHLSKTGSIFFISSVKDQILKIMGV